MTTRKRRASQRQRKARARAWQMTGLVAGFVVVLPVACFIAYIVGDTLAR